MISRPDANLPTRTVVEKWAAIAGRWSFNGTIATYNGPEEASGQPPLGLALGSVRFRDGQIATRIKLSRNERTSAGIIFGYHSFNSPYLLAALGAYNKAYAISEFRPGHGWSSLADAGTLANLGATQEHELVVTVNAQTVRMTVDDVDVLDTVIRRPIEGTGAGLYAWDDAEIEFSETVITGVRPRIFVIMPFSEPYDTLYREVIFPVADGAGFEIVRVDEIHGPGIILDDIQQQIEQAHAVVAEISSHNPNVFYELGYAHALHKPAVILVRREEGTRMPFDVRGYRAIFYDDSIGGKRNVERNLRQHLDAIRTDS
ncbi:MAG: hypothetical protein WD875_13395 [Pirellulales bacterium]